MPTATDYLYAGAPDWELIDFDLACPRCGYNLYLLPNARCPECGLDFDWERVLEAGRFKSDFLFEHNWRERPVRSLLHTLALSLRPVRFWRRVSIYEHVRAGPLLFLIALAAPLFFLVFHLTAFVLSWALERIGSIALVDGSRFSGVISEFVYAFRVAASTTAYTVPQVIFAFFWLAGTTILLASLRQTLGRCRVRSVQVLRVIAYTAPPASVLLALLAVILVGADRWFTGNSALVWFQFAVLAIGVPLGIVAAYLWIGLARYLRLPHAFALAVVSSAVGLLFACTTMIAVSVWLLV